MRYGSVDGWGIPVLESVTSNSERLLEAQKELRQARYAKAAAMIELWMSGSKEYDESLNFALSITDSQGGYPCGGVA